ncbi:alpha/beta fold hydrolase [Actinosynnema sp. NPDC023587]|uniref:thioesterase II family protein n=1 Tax=Actinosynnema sp. NPDC023587 TaxID=3154695 RepID=UPI0033FC76FE
MTTRLYCFPHAGATAAVYRPWKELTGPDVRLVGLDRPGRGTAARHPKLAGLPALVDWTAGRLLDDLREARAERPDVGWATFGHSFGALLGLAVAGRVAALLGEDPRCAVLSAALPPALQEPGDVTTALSDAELLDKIMRDGGTPSELTTSSAMTGYFLALMREDYRIRAQYREQTGLRVDFPLVLVAATDDVHVRPAQMWRWAGHTSAPTRRVEVPGDHFAAIRDPRAVLAVVHEATSPSAATSDEGR